VANVDATVQVGNGWNDLFSTTLQCAERCTGAKRREQLLTIGATMLVGSVRSVDEALRAYCTGEYSMQHVCCTTRDLDALVEALWEQ